MAIANVFTRLDTGEMVEGSVIMVKNTAGDPSSPQESQIVVNTIDQTIRLYVSAAWVTLFSW